MNIYKTPTRWKLIRFVISLSTKESERFFMAKILDVFYFSSRFSTTSVNYDKWECFDHLINSILNWKNWCRGAIQNELLTEKIKNLASRYAY
jgi:hypothetical protein